MKKLYPIIMAAAFVALTGCQNDPEPVVTGEEANGELITFVASDDAATRTWLDDDGTTVTWIVEGEVDGYPGDKIVVYKSKSDGGYDYGVYTATERNPDGTGVKFTGGGLTWAAGETSADFYAYYEGGKVPLAFSASPTEIALQIEQQSTQAGYYAERSRVGSNNVMAATPIKVNKSDWGTKGGIPLVFKNLYAVLEINMASTKPGVYVTSVTAKTTSGVPLSVMNYNLAGGSTTIDITSPTPSFAFMSNPVMSVQAQVTFVSPLELPVVNDIDNPSKTVPVRMLVNPGTHNVVDGFTISANIEGYSSNGMGAPIAVTKGSAAGPVFTAGKKTSTTVVLDPDMSVVKDKLTILSVTPGAGNYQSANYATYRAFDSDYKSSCLVSKNDPQTDFSVTMNTTKGELKMIMVRYDRRQYVPKSYSVSAYVEGDGWLDDPRSYVAGDDYTKRTQRGDGSYNYEDVITLEVPFEDVTAVKLTIEKGETGYCYVRDITLNSDISNVSTNTPHLTLNTVPDASGASGTTFVIKAGFCLPEAPHVVSMPTWAEFLTAEQGTGEEGCFWNLVFRTTEANSGAERSGEIVLKTGNETVTANVKQSVL